MKVSRATYMALNVYQDEGPITQVCADDVDTCSSILEEKVLQRTGAVMACLKGMQRGTRRNSTGTPKSRLSPGCSELLAVAQPPDMSKEYDENLQVWHLRALLWVNICHACDVVCNAIMHLPSRMD